MFCMMHLNKTERYKVTCCSYNEYTSYSRHCIRM